MQVGIGKLSGIVEVRGPDGKLKTTSPFTATITAGQAEKLKLTLEKNDGDSTQHNSTDSSS